MEEKIWQIAQRKSEDLLIQLLLNRNLENISQQEDFLFPPDPETFGCPPQLPGLNVDDFKKAVSLIKEAIVLKRPIVIHGDYDVDGIGATAILWETIYFGLGYKNVYPFIPDRFSEGYGLSRKSLEKINEEYDGIKGQEPLLVTVDCGITAESEVAFAHQLGFKVIIVDHHVRPEKLPKAEAIVWTDNLCSGGLSWFLSFCLDKDNARYQLDLAALTIVADLQPLTDVNRSLLKAGLKSLETGKRVGIRSLAEAAGMSDRTLGTYELGWVIAPRLNAAGRLENALTALRLLCTRDLNQAKRLAKGLNEVNAERQRITLEAFNHAREIVSSKQVDKILMVVHEDYHEGIIGLVAGRLVQEFYRPSLVISKGEIFSKGSARSVRGFDIIAALKKIEELFEGLGGHPMAAGFTVKTENLRRLEEALFVLGEKEISSDLLKAVVNVDAEVPLSSIADEFWKLIRKLEPFGLGNPTPVFLSRNVRVVQSRCVGTDGKHLKLLLQDSGRSYLAMWFGEGDCLQEFPQGTLVDIVYSLMEDRWNGQQSLGLNIKDLKVSTP